MANTCIALNIFNQLAGSYRGQIRLKNLSEKKVLEYADELRRRGETVPNYLMATDGLDVILTLDICRTCKGTGKTNEF
jgi:hypothetical protein